MVVAKGSDTPIMTQGQVPVILRDSELTHAQQRYIILSNIANYCT